MQIAKSTTDTYTLTHLDGLDPVTVYTADLYFGAGRITITCFGKAWNAFWPAMGDLTLREFVLSADNAYIIGKMVQETQQTDFDEINKRAAAKGFEDFYVSSDIEVVDVADTMAKVFGEDWRMDLPRCHTDEYRYLSKILDAVKEAFKQEEVAEEFISIPMPLSLTAENGAKALMMGEFSEGSYVSCPDCYCIDEGEDKDSCETCLGEGELYQKVPVSWTTIKDIYAMAVEHFKKET